MIDPAETRKYVIGAFEMTVYKKRNADTKKTFCILKKEGTYADSSK